MIAGKDGHVNYDIIDSSIPEALDYNKALIKGQTMKVIFQSGNLTGREFDLKYKHDGRRFELVQPHWGRCAGRRVWPGTRSNFAGARRPPGRHSLHPEGE